LCELRKQAGVDARELARTSQLFLDWEQVEVMSSAGTHFANHTCSHPNLANLRPDSCRAEITSAQQAIARVKGARMSLAYPFGKRSEITRQIALELGIITLLEVEGVNAPFDPTRVGRIKMRSDSVPVLFAKMEIMEPAKALLKKALRKLRWRTE
jgi:peptidoglycan/xylan/chitin deacetylase (PgdA/CDA1 family)